MDHKILHTIFLSGLLSWSLIRAPAALAQVEGPTWYGRINVTFDKINREGAINIANGQVGVDQSQWEINSRASRLGVKGAAETEALGLEAFYLIEYEINVDDGNRGDAAISQRNIYGGLRGGFGEIRYGKIDTILKSAEGKVDQFNDVVDLDQVIGGQNRIANLFHYKSPLIANAITVNAEFSPSEGTDVDLDGDPDIGVADTVGASVEFNRDNIYIALAYETNQFARRSLDNISRADISRLVATWKTSHLEVGGLIQSVKDVLPQSNAEDIAYLASGAVRNGRLKFKGQVGIAEGKNSGETGTLGALGIDYTFSGKTFLFAYAAFLKTDKTDLQDDAFGIGVSHSF